MGMFIKNQPLKIKSSENQSEKNEKMVPNTIEDEESSEYSDDGTTSQIRTHDLLDQLSYGSLSDTEWIRVIYDNKKSVKEAQKEMAKRKILRDDE